jgi:hypothetical protein
MWRCAPRTVVRIIETSGLDEHSGANAQRGKRATVGTAASVFAWPAEHVRQRTPMPDTLRFDPTMVKCDLEFARGSSKS